MGGSLCRPKPQQIDPQNAVGANMQNNPNDLNSQGQQKKNLQGVQSTEASQVYVRIPNDQIQKINKINLQRVQLASLIKQVKFSPKTIKINPHIKKRYGINADFVHVPFDVIMLTMHPDLIECMRQFQQTKYKKYMEEAKAGKKSWKLHKNGYYVNYQYGYIVSIIDYNSYYHGPLLRDPQQRIVPTQDGILVTTEGHYKGTFVAGKADGQGTYLQYVKQPRQNVMYQGKWSNGVLLQGTIRKKQFIFNGVIKNRYANGDGIIKFKRAVYTGNFQNGIYQTKINQNAKYETFAYLYEGQFNQGYKEGLGLLVQKDRAIKDKKIKYQPPDEYPGQYQHDYYMTPKQQKMQYENTVDRKKKLNESLIKEQAQQ